MFSTAPCSDVNSASIRSVAFCVSDPGISNSSRSEPPTVATRTIRTTMMPIQLKTTRHGCVAHARAQRASAPVARRSWAALRPGAGAPAPVGSSSPCVPESWVPESWSVIPAPLSLRFSHKTGCSPRTHRSHDGQSCGCQVGRDGARRHAVPICYRPLLPDRRGRRSAPEAQPSYGRGVVGSSARAPFAARSRAVAGLARSSHVAASSGTKRSATSSPPRNCRTTGRS